MTTQLGGPRAWFQWSLGVWFVVLVFALHTGYAITNASVAADLGLTIAQVGLIGAVYTWAFALSQFASGSILDRLGARRVLPVACLIVSGAAFVFASADGLPLLVVANVLAALGASFGFIGAGFVGGQWFHPLKYGLMFSLVQFVASLSAIAGQRTLAALIQTTPWTDLIRGLGLAGLVIAALMLLFLRDRERGARARVGGLGALARDLLRDLGAVLSRRDTWINALIGGATMGTMLGLGVVWGPRLLVAGGMVQSDAFAAGSLAWAGLAFGAPAFAWLSESLRSRVKPMALGCAAQAGTLIVILLRADSSPTEASLWFFAFGFMAGGSMLPFTVGAELVPASLIGTSAAFVNAVQFLVGGVMLAVPGSVLAGTGLIARLRAALAPEGAAPAGTLADHQWALAVMPAALGVGLLLCLVLKETRRHDGGQPGVPAG